VLLSNMASKWRTIQVKTATNELRHYSLSGVELDKCEVFRGWLSWPKYSTTCLALPQEIDGDAFEAAVELLRDYARADQFIATPLEAAKVFEVAQCLQCLELAKLCIFKIEQTLASAEVTYPPTHYQEVATIAREYALDNIAEKCEQVLKQYAKPEEKEKESTEEAAEDELSGYNSEDEAPEFIPSEQQPAEPLTQPMQEKEIDTSTKNGEMKAGQVGVGGAQDLNDPWVTIKHGRKLAFFGPKEEGVPESPRPMLKRQVPRLLSKVRSTNVDVPQTADALLTIAFDNELVSREEAIEWMSNCHLGHESQVAHAVNDKGDAAKKQSCC